MATITSLGIHRPSAVPFLVAEGILPAEPSPHLYEWRTVPKDASNSNHGVEELLTTERCVVWSRGGAVERIFRFDVEKEPVQNALFTYFDGTGTHENHASSPEYMQQESQVAGILDGLGLDTNVAQADGSNADIEGGTDWSPKKLLVQRAEKSLQKQRCLIRALVVVLKTSAHVFFLSGTSHIVHLPFEVDGAFPLPRGLLIQRKLPQALTPSTPAVPSVPPNSFAFETLTSSEAGCGSQTLASLNNLSEMADPDFPFSSMLNNLLQQASDNATNDVLPRLYCLTDPLTEIGVVVSEGKLQPKRNLQRQHDLRGFDTIESTEDIVYVSRSDDLGQQYVASHGISPTLIIVTHNQQSREYTIWSAEYVNDQSLASGPRSPKSRNGRGTRRRSSYGIGTSTGVNTPVARVTVPGRESFGVIRSRSSAARDLLSEDSFNDGEDNLASHLDSALDNSSAPMKSSRRVSSLLARADLSSNQDKSAFSDLAGGFPASTMARKGGPFGSHVGRVSSGTETGNSILRVQRPGGLRTSIEPPTVAGSYEADMEDDNDEDDTESDCPKNSSMRDQFRGFRKEMAFTKIRTVASEKVNKSRTSHILSHSTTPDIFILKPPAHIARPNIEDADAFLCIADQSAATLVVVGLRQRSGTNTQTGKKQKTGTTRLHNSLQRCEVQITSVTRSSGVIGASRIWDEHCSRLMVLSHGPNGSDELHLRDPWGPQCTIQLPSKLFLNDPYRLVHLLSPKQKREGGYKRILSQGPQALMGLSHGGNSETVDLLNAEGSKHRIEVQLQPRNPFIGTMIRVCDSSLPRTGNDGEVILNGWWNAMAWLSAKSDVEAELEWTAFVVVLFSIAAGFVEDRRAETMTRHKKRKSGLLRSSSGANTNLESWEAMLVEESGASRSVSAWMQGEAWAWTSKQAKILKPAESAVSRNPKSSSRSSFAPTLPPQKKSPYLLTCMSLAREFKSSSSDTGIMRGSVSLNRRFADSNSQRLALATLLVGLHLLREEYKLNILAATAAHDLTPVLAQIGAWLEWPSWGFNASAHYMLENADMESWLFDDSPVMSTGVANPAEPFQPPSIMHFVEAASLHPPSTSFISLLDVVGYQPSKGKIHPRHESWAKELAGFTPRTTAINGLLTPRPGQSMQARVAEMLSWGWSLSTLETLPESIAVPFRSAISICQSRPTASSDKDMLEILGRDDIGLHKEESHAIKLSVSPIVTPPNEVVRDVNIICNSSLDVDTIGAYEGTAEADRQSTSRMVFKRDQRFAEAAKLLHPLHAPVAKCIPEPEWSDTDLLEAQQELAKTIAMRTLAVSPGRSCLFYSARLPLLTEKFPIHGFTLSCVMKPSNTTVTADKAAYTEEKVSWAFFHAGVEAGLSIAKGAKGIDTSWILFNKPHELKNRHAGFLLALGLNGHLKSIAKWVAFKYLTPKHTMTSIGLLLGLAASYLGTMDTLITRLLSVHVTRMLPPGAAELNLSPLTQTSGIMGIGLLYCRTQHRRMSEIMLSEMENEEEDDSANPQDTLRDEGYRLAAGFALGFINLGCGGDLKGLHDMHIIERLLALAIGTKKVSIVHILDKATAAATVAVALIFMKTQNGVLARKIDIPDTAHQFEYVRPDIFLLRTLARHLIMWNDIQATSGWMKAQVPTTYQYKVKLTTIRTLNSDEMPFFNIIAGLCLAIGLRNAGSGSAEVRSLLCHYLDQFIRICKLPVLNYDGKLARITVRNCQDVVALAAACVMAGTGDLHVFRRLRALHGHVDTDIPYGSHLAAHLAIGILFLGGGTYSFGTSNLAVAALICAFYPLFPATVLDNKSHLQAFRHFWVFAAEPRCLVIHDIDTRRLISIPVVITLRSGIELPLTAPCLLPELNSVTKIQTNDPEYWSITLDLADNTSDSQTFGRHQNIWVRRRATYDAHLSLFSATMQALDDARSAHTLRKHVFEWVFKLKTFQDFDRAEQALVLPPDLASVVYRSTRGTVVDDRLVLETGCMTSGKSERLWNLRMLFAWADALSRSGGQWGWIGKEVVERLRTRLMTRKALR